MVMKRRSNKNIKKERKRESKRDENMKENEKRDSNDSKYIIKILENNSFEHYKIWVGYNLWKIF